MDGYFRIRRDISEFVLMRRFGFAKEENKDFLTATISELHPYLYHQRKSRSTFFCFAHLNCEYQISDRTKNAQCHDRVTNKSRSGQTN